jgi:folate-binding protein YgfZ
MTILLKYFKNLFPQQIEQFAALEHLYKDWNSKINVISRKDIDELYERHILHSLGIAKVHQFLPNSNVMDVGTGGGFPAIPLAIMFPETQFDAIDVIATASELPTVGEETEIPHIDMYRVDAQWPRVGADILVGDIPATTGVISVAVSFSKGCYPGQELVERMDSRGANAPVRVVALSKDGVGVGSRIQVEGADVGTVTSIGFTRALARVARGASIGVDLSSPHGS